LEFSFERNRQSISNSQRVESDPLDGESQSNSSSSSDRLRKAIERNRAKQRNRDLAQSQTISNQNLSSKQSSEEPRSEIPSDFTEGFNNQNYGEASSNGIEHEEVNIQTEPFYESSDHYAGVRNSRGNFSSEDSTEDALPKFKYDEAEYSRVQNDEDLDKEAESVKVEKVARKSVVNHQNEIEFVPVKRNSKKLKNEQTSAAEKKSKPKSFGQLSLNDLLWNASWIFCLFLMLRLVFSQGGVLDFYDLRSTLNDRHVELMRLKSENMQLVKEIEKMQTDQAYQKRLVRDHLGFIAEDEFLILFPQS